MSDKEKTTVEAQTEQPQPKAPGAEAELTVQDLQAIKQVIDVASQRGAFRPNEMTTVGGIYTKLEAFLAAVSSQQQAKGE